jgi:predicted Zn-dependent protease
MALEKTGDLQGAREAIDSSLRLAPGGFPARLLLGEVYLRLKNPGAAADQFLAALLLQPESLPARLDLVRSEIDGGNLRGAAQELEGLSRSHPDDPDVFDLLAGVLRSMGELNRAEEAEARSRQLRKERPKDS